MSPFVNVSESECVRHPLWYLQHQAEQVFRSLRGVNADLVVAAPGRVNLIGEHIDYNDGFVLPMAIERYVIIAAAVHANGSDPVATFYSEPMNDTRAVPLDGSLRSPSEGWIRYVEGVIAGFTARQISLPSFDAVVVSNVPLGGGLSSSAALEVATATLLEALSGHTLTNGDKALLCQAAEHQFAGVPCGIMDQFSSVFGKSNELMLLDCRDQTIHRVAFAAEDLTVLIINSNVKHDLTGGEYAARRADCDAALRKLGASSWRHVTMQELAVAADRLTGVEFRRARHVVTEIVRAKQAAQAIEQNDWMTAGTLMQASHASLRDDYEVSCPELDRLVDLATELGPAAGVFGSRMTGGGFGGCTVTLVRSEQANEVRDAITRSYTEDTGIVPEAFASRPARGAHQLTPLNAGI